MNANLDAVIEKINEEMRTWQMPEQSLGDRVMWYPSEQQDEERGCVAIVTDMTSQYLELVLLGRKQHMQLKRQARHGSDPRLALGGDWLSSGTWNSLPPSHADRSLGGQVRSLQGKVQELYKTRETVSNELKPLLEKLAEEVERLDGEILEVKKAIARVLKDKEQPAAA